MALTVNGKRNCLERDDFLAFAESIGIEANYAERNHKTIYISYTQMENLKNV